MSPYLRDNVVPFPNSDLKTALSESLEVETQMRFLSDFTTELCREGSDSALGLLYRKMIGLQDQIMAEVTRRAKR